MNIKALTPAVRFKDSDSSTGTPRRKPRRRVRRRPRRRRARGSNT